MLERLQCGSILLGLMAVLAAACGDAAPAVSSSPSNSSVAAASVAAEPSEHRDLAGVTLSRQGGLCPEGECGFEVRASEEDGEWVSDGVGVTPARGEVDPEDVAVIAEFIVSHFDELTAQPFAGECPTAHDGQELAITVRLLPRGPDAHLRDAQVFTTNSCTHAWPASVVEEIATKWQAAGMPAVFRES